MIFVRLFDGWVRKSGGSTNCEGMEGCGAQRTVVGLELVMT